MGQEMRPVDETEVNPESTAAKLAQAKQSTAEKLEAAKKLFDDLQHANSTADRQAFAVKLEKYLKEFNKFEAETVDKSRLLELLIAKVPLLAGLLTSIDRVGGATSGLFKVEGFNTDAVKAASSGFQIGGIIITGLDLFRVPLVYLGCYIAGVESPITLSQKGRWVYSVIALSLAIVGLAVPAVAPWLGLTAAGLSLVVATGSLIKLSYLAYKTRKDLRKVKVELEETTLTFNTTKEEITALLEELKTCNEPGRIIEIGALVKELQQKLTVSAVQLQTLHNTQAEKEKEIKKLGITAFLDKAVIVGLSSLAIAGMALVLFFPVAGGAILAGTAVVGLSYGVARLVIPLVTPYVVSGWKKLTSSLGWSKDNAEGSTLENNLDQQQTPPIEIKNQFKALGPPQRDAEKNTKVAQHQQKSAVQTDAEVNEVNTVAEETVRRQPSSQTP